MKPYDMRRLALLISIAFTQSCFAQAASAPLTRSEVKTETRAAAKAHELIPAGEAIAPIPAKVPKSNYTRAQRKVDTLQARKNGDLSPVGDAADEERAAKQQARAPRSTKTRSQRKAETLAAAKAHQLIPAGEGPTAYPK
jgi:hypothetical protein